jgi:hypothetical protein
MPKTKKRPAHEKRADANAGHKPAIPKPNHLRLWIAAPGVALAAAVIVYYWPVLSLRGFLWNDFIEQNFPYRLFAARSLNDGVFPFWNPYVFSGMPFFADVQAAVLYPLNALLTFFVRDDWLSPILLEYQVVLHIGLAGMFLWLLARDFGLSRLPALIAAMTFMFSAFFTTHIFHVNLIHAAAWFPLAFLFVKRSLERTSILYAGLAAATLAAAFLAGYPQLMVHGYYALGAWFLFMLILRVKTGTAAPGREAKQGALFAGLIALAVALSAVQLLPTQELGAHSARPTLGFAESCEGSFRLYRFVTLLIPKFFGSPDSIYWGVSLADINAGMHSYWETAMYVGILPLLLAAIAVALVRSPAVWFFSGLGAVSILLAMGDSFFLYWVFYKLLPGFDRFRVPARFAFMFSLSIAMLAGFGLQALMRHIHDFSPLSRRRLSRIILSIGCLGIGAALFVSLGVLRPAVADFIAQSGRFDPSVIERLVDERVYPAVIEQTWLFALFLAASAALLMLRIGQKAGARQFGAAALALLFADLCVFGYGYAARQTDPREVYATAPLIEQLRTQSHKELFRINMRDSRPGTTDLGGRNMLLQKNQGSVHELFLMEGYNPLRLGRQLIDRNEQILDILNVKYFIQSSPRTQQIGFALNEDRLPRAWFAASHIIIPDEQRILSTLKDPDFDPRQTVVLESRPPAGPPDASAGAAQATVTIDDYSLNEITMTVTSDRPGYVVLSEIYYPNWRARVNDKDAPLYRADYALRAIPVPAGRSRIQCSYRSPAFRRGLIITLFGLIALCASVAGPILFARIRGVPRRGDSAS